MTRKELIYRGLKIIFLFACIFFRVLLGRDTEFSIVDERGFDQESHKTIEDTELTEGI